MEKAFQCIKVKDGLYLGSRVVAYDLQFLLINKFAYVVNCAAQVPDIFQQQGIKYLKFKIHQDKHELIFDGSFKRLIKLKKFIDEAEQNGVCCLIHCGNGRNRSLFMITALLMDRFRWRLRKTIEYLQSKGISIILTQRNIEQLGAFEFQLAKQSKLSQGWNGPYIDEEQELIMKTFINTTKQNIPEILKGKYLSPKKQFLKDEVVVEKSEKRVKWQDKIDKQLKREKKRLDNERLREEKFEEKSKEKLEEEIIMKRQSKTHNIIMPKDKVEIKRIKKKIEPELDPELKKKLEEAEILKLIKKSGKLKKQLIAQQNYKANQSEQQQYSAKGQRVSPEEEEKNIYKLTINNYINPNINIIKPPLDKKKKSTKQPTKRQKDKFNRTYSEKESFKRPTFFEKQIPKQKTIPQKQKRNTGHTPIRGRKQRKSQKQKDLKL